MAHNKMSDLRDHLFEQIERIKDADKPEDLEAEIKKSKTIAAISAQIIEAAKLELQYIDKIGSDNPVFFQDQQKKLNA